MSNVDLRSTADRAVHHGFDPGTAPLRSPGGRETHRGRFQTWTGSALRDAGYMGAVLLWSVVGFTVLVAGVSVTASLLPLVFGVFVWVAYVHLLRWTTSVDRRLAGWQRGRAVAAAYRRPAARGFLPMLRSLSSDPQTWRDLGWLALTSVVGFILGIAAITFAALVLAALSMPTWYWAMSHPQVGYGTLRAFTADTLPEAFGATAIGLALTPLLLLFARWSAATHAGLAARILSPTQP